MSRQTVDSNVPAELLSQQFRRTHDHFLKWRPSELQEWAKRARPGAKYNLARSGVPAITELHELPGGPIVPNLVGVNWWGHEGLKTTIADWYGTKSENVLIAQGASQCNFLIAGAALADGGTAVVETPVYQPILRAVEVWADEVIRLPRRASEEYQPDPDELRGLIGNRTRLIVLTNLHNPSHVLLDSDRFSAVLECARKVGAVVMLDEVFLPMLERNHQRHGFAQGAVSINSLGKSWGLDTLRVGWAVGPKELIRTAYRLNNLLGVNQPYLTEDLACRILNNGAAVEYLTARANRAASGRLLMEQFLDQTPSVSCVRPNGGISALIRLPDGTDDLEFADRLEKLRNTVVFPGSLFECPGTIRVSFGGDPAEMKEGLSRLSQMIKELP